MGKVENRGGKGGELKDVEKLGNNLQHIWIPPNAGFMKINFDASFNRCTLDATRATICRDDNGRIIGGAYRKYKANSAESAETKAAEIAILLAKELKLGRIIVEGDNDIVIEALNERKTLAWETQEVFDFVFSNINNFQDAFLFHVIEEQILLLID